jgi:hypothetical protein
VIPVLIDGAALPAPADLPEGLRNLAFRQAAPWTVPAISIRTWTA